jgi:hypothetical protein
MLALVSVGCSGGTTSTPGPQTPTGENPQPASSAPALPEIGDLPEMSAVLPNVLDEGRLKTREPLGWDRQPRSNKYVMAWLESNQSRYPQLFLKSTSSPRERTTSANAESQRLEMSEEVKGDVAMTTLGGQPAFYYRRQAKGTTGETIYYEHITTFFDGRRIEASILMQPSDERAHRKYLFALAQGVQLIEGGSADDSAPEEESAPEDESTGE